MAKRHRTDGRPTISHIAQLAGVSAATVSKVMNGRADVAPPTRERVQQIIIEQGLMRDRVARAFRKGRAGVVQLVLPRLDDEYFLPILEGAAQVLREAGVRLELTSSSDRPEAEVRRIDSGAGHAVDGMLVVLPSEEAIAQLERSQRPFVLIRNQGGLLSTAPSVRITSWEGGFVATKRIDLGHKRIAYIGNTTPARDAIERIAGYRAALDAADLPINPRLQCAGAFNEADGYTAAKDLFALPEPPTAVFAGNDRQAAGVYRAFHELGVSIPADVSVVGFDNLPFTELLSPPLTTVHAPRLELGRTAASMLARLINGERLDAPRVVLPTRFVERQSCPREAELDRDYVRAFGAAVLAQFPGCPVEEATRIAEHACRKYSGRVGRSSEAKRFDPEAVRLATRAAVRHRFTKYDDLLLGGMERYEARSSVASAVERKLNEWSAGGHID